MKTEIHYDFDIKREDYTNLQRYLKTINKDFAWYNISMLLSLIDSHGFEVDIYGRILDKRVVISPKDMNDTNNIYGCSWGNGFEGHVEIFNGPTLIENLWQAFVWITWFQCKVKENCNPHTCDADVDAVVDNWEWYKAV